MSSLDLISQFIDAMRAEGIEPANPGDIVPTAKLRRFDLAGDPKQSLKGYYFLHLDNFANGGFGSWPVHNGELVKWHQSPDQPTRKLSERERQALQDQIRKAELERQRQKEELHKEAKAKANAIWSESGQCYPDHPYLERKHVKPHMARLGGGLSLIIPVVSSGELVGLQFIQSDGEKRFLFGTPIEGAYCPFGKPTDTIVICEGWATAASIHEATGLFVASAFNSGNLEAVARAMRARNPEALILIAADDDRWKDYKGKVKNPGVHYATQAASAVSGELRRPQFSPSHQDTKPTDFNDLHVLEGLDEVRHQIESGKPRQEIAQAITSVDKTQHAIVREQVSLRAPYPHMRQDKSGNPTIPYCSIENVAELLNRLGCIARYDIIKKDNHITIPDRAFLKDTQKNDKLAYILSHATLAQIPTAQVPEYVNYIASQNPYNPVQEWVCTKPWDGKSRLEDLYATLKAKNEEHDERVLNLKKLFIRKWLVSAIAAAFEPNGVSAHGVLVLRGEQNLGKTSWFKRLVPHNPELIVEGQTLDPKDKDNVYQVVSHWLVELGELDATFRKADIAQLKSFLVKQEDTIRRPYARLESTFARRTVFFGSVNERDYLADPTGNRRFWTVDLEAVDFHHQIDMQQLWAEVLKIYKTGEKWWLTPEQVLELNEHNKQFEIQNPLEERIRDRFDWSMSGRRPMTASEIAIELGITNPQTKDLRLIGKAMRDITGEDAHKSNGRKVFSVAPAKFGVV